MSAKRAAGRPQDPAIGEAILRATQDLLIERGVAGTTVDAVAAAAGAGKAAVYRRWETKTALIIAAVRALYDPPATPDTGSLREDLLACALHYARDDERAAFVLASVLAEMGRDDELGRAAYEAIGEPPSKMLTAVLERWAARGEIPAGAPLDLVTTILPALAFESVVRRHRTLDPRTAEELVDRVLLPALHSS
jgi:AcrR family transcriptional regulator